MWFRRKRHRDDAGPREAPSVESRELQRMGVGDEVEAYLQGRYARHLIAKGRTPPAWVALNRVAHATHDELAAVVVGNQGPGSALAGRRPTWAEAERFLAAHLLANSGTTPERLARIQRDALVPLELSLIDRVGPGEMTAGDVLDAGTCALDSYRPGA